MRADIQALQIYIDTMVGIKSFSYPARQDGDRPEGAFAVISLLTEKAVGLPNTTITSETVEETVRMINTPSRLRFRVGIVEDEGLNSFKIQNGWYKEEIKQLMMKLGYGFISCQPISLEDAKLESFWEARQGFSIDLYVTRQETEIVSNITSMRIGGTYVVPDLTEIALELNLNP